MEPTAARGGSLCRERVLGDGANPSPKGVQEEHSSWSLGATPRQDVWGPPTSSLADFFAKPANTDCKINFTKVPS